MAKEPVNARTAELTPLVGWDSKRRTGVVKTVVCDSNESKDEKETLRADTRAPEFLLRRRDGPEGP